MNIIFDYNRTLFDPETNGLYPGVFDILKELSSRHELFLVSRNAPERRVELAQLGIEQYFKTISFVEEKSQELFTKLAGSAEKILVIGDSIADEITIGNMLGFTTIRMKQGAFGTQTPSHPIQVPTHEISTIADITRVIASYES